MAADSTQDLFRQAVERVAERLVAEDRKDPNVTLDANPELLRIRGRLDAETWYRLDVPEDVLRTKGPDWIADQFVEMYRHAQREEIAPDEWEGTCDEGADDEEGSR